MTIFDRWFEERWVGLRIRLFEAVVRAILGGGVGLEGMGSSPNQILVIETDGGIEPVDFLRICGDGFTKVGANVLTHGLDEALSTELARLYYFSAEELPSTCRVCAIRLVCGGGHLAHRWSSADGFDNPSVYCGDLMKLIVHIRSKLLASLPPSARTRLGLEPILLEDVREQVCHHVPLRNDRLRYRRPPTSVTIRSTSGALGVRSSN